MKIDKVYIITLDQSDENKKSILERLVFMGVPNQTTYIIFDGVNGRELFSTEQGRLDYGIKFYDGWKLDDSNEFWNRGVTAGEAGGMCSHIKVWEDAYKNGYENILILEDDYNPEQPFPWDVCNELENYEYDILFLSRKLQSGHSDVEIGFQNFVVPGYSYQTHSYVVSKSGIKKLVETHLPTLKQNIIVSDEFLPSTYTTHPREDIRNMYQRNISALAYRYNPITQLRFEAIGNSLTSPVVGIDY